MNARRKVLVVDDEEMVRNVVKRMLEGAGYEVAFAENADRGIYIVEAFKPHAVVTDLIMLPGMNGYDFSHTIRKNGYSGGIVLAASGARSDYSLKDLTVFDSLIDKPYSPKQLRAEVENAIRAADSRQSR